VSDRTFEEITARFTAVYNWAARTFGEDEMERAHAEFEPKAYPRPRGVTSAREWAAA
jgi:hypothetical protein